MPFAPKPWRFLRRCLRAAVLAAAVGAAGACAANPGVSGGPFPAFREYEGREVESLRFTGDLVVSRDSLKAAIATKATDCPVPLNVCPFGLLVRRHYLSLNDLSRDVARIQLYHRDHGYYGTRVTPDVQPADDPDDPDGDVSVTFLVEPGDRVTLRDLTVTGVADSLFRPGELERRLPLREGRPFARRDFLASADSVREALLQRGYAYAQVFRNYQIDTIADVATVEFAAEPGPLVRVDSVLIVGRYRLEEKIVRRQLAFREGDLLRQSDLNQSQRNLYDMELVRFASVAIAPDSLQLRPDSLELLPDTVGTTVLVTLNEAARYAADVSLGFGTLDCLRGQAVHTDRDFLGGARRLQVTGSLSKVGVGSPVALENTFLCRALDPDDTESDLERRINTTLNYRLAADFLQPQLFGTRTSVVLGAHTERTSEIGLYLRRSVGAQAGFVRRVAPRTVLTGTVNVEQGRTEAQDLFFCRAFERCIPDDIEKVRESRWTNWVALGLVHTATRGPSQSPTGGYTVRAGVDYASSFLGSDDGYLRGVAEAAVYREIRRGWLLSGRVTAGTFLTGFIEGDDGYIPPERRFYAGGPNSVRGYPRNDLGPQVYVAQTSAVRGDDGEPPNPIAYRTSDIVASATGGTQTVILSAELETPFPVYSQYLRFAAFVDAGQVWDRVNDCRAPADSLPKLRCSLSLRVTPGAGLRIATPVGPIRVDAAYNPYRREPGPLYLYDGETGDFIQPLGVYQPPDPDRFWDRLTFQVAVGRAF